MSRYVSYRSARATRPAASGKSTRLVEFTSRAEVQRDSLKDDAEILRRRGLPNGTIAQRLGVDRRTIIRWFA